MGYVKIAWLSVLSFAFFFIAFTPHSMGQQASKASGFDEAQRLYSAGKYTDADAILSAEMKKGNAPLNVISLAMETQLKLGNVITANQIAATALKLNDGKNSKLLFRAAEIAELAGDSRLAMSRYDSFCKASAFSKSPEMIKAVRYLASHGSFGTVYKEYIELFGIDSALVAFANSLLMAKETEQFVKLFELVMKKYSDSYYVNSIFLNAVAANQKKFSGDETKRIIDVIVARKLASPLFASYFYSLMRDAFKNDQQRLFEYSSQFQDANKLVMPSDLWLQPAGRLLASTSDPAAKSLLVKKFFAAEDIYKNSSSRNDYRDFCQTVFANPAAFSFSAEIANPQRFAAMLNTLYKKYPADSKLVNAMTNTALNNYFKDDKSKKAALLRACLPDLDRALIQQLSTLDPSHVNEDAAAYLKGLTGFSLESAEWNLIGFYRSAKQKDKFMAVMKSYMLYNPNFDRKFVANELLATFEFITSVDIITLVDDVYAKGGYTNNLVELLKDLGARGKNIGAAPEFKTSMASLQQKKAGSDQLFALFANIANTPANKAESSAQVAAIASKFAAFNTTVLPDSADLASSPQEYLLYRLWELDVSLPGAPAASACIGRWASKAKIAGEVWNQTLKNAIAKNGGKINKSISSAAPAYIKLLVSGQKDPNAYDTLSMLTKPSGVKEDSSIFIPLYSNYPSLSIEYIRNQESFWTPPFYYAQITAVMGSNALNPNDIQNVVSACSGGVIGRTQVSQDAGTAIVSALIAVEKQSKGLIPPLETSVFNLILRGNNSAVFVNAFDKYLNQIPASSNYQKLQFFNELFTTVNMPSNIAAKAAGDDLVKLFSAWPEKDWQESLFAGKILDVLQAASKDSSLPQSAQAATLCNRLISAVLAEKVNIRNWGVNPSVFQSAAIDIFASNNAEASVVAFAVIGELLELPENQNAGINFVKQIISGSEKYDTLIQPRYIFLSRLMNRNTPFSNDVKNEYSPYLAKLARNIPGVMAVDKSNPSYPLFAAEQLFSDGNSTDAWTQIKGRIPLLQKRWKELDYSFVLWTIEQMRKQKMYKDALGTAMTLWAEESRFAPEDSGRLAVIKGDIYRDMKNFPSAKLEYESLTTNPRYARTDSSSQAKFRLADLLIAMQDYSNAKSMLERLTDSNSLTDQAEAYYLLAKISAEQKEYKEANDYLKLVFKRVYGHVSARLLEGELRLILKNVRDSEIQIGDKRLQTIVVPGEILDFAIQDNNLSIARGGKSIPIVVTTSSGKDKETLNLLPSADDPNVFTGKLNTALGKAVPANKVLEVTGVDEVSYIIAPDFQKTNNLNYPAKKLEVRFPAKLIASSKKISSALKEGELEDDQADQPMRTAVRNSKVLRPGSPLYIQITDYAMDVSDAQDKVYVDIKASSGDEVKNVELIETAPHSGVFEAVVKTGVPFPMVIASDSKEDIDVNSVINSTKKGGWVSLPDGKKPKWLMVDMMKSVKFKDINLSMPDARAVKELKVFGILDKTEELLASYPDEGNKASAGGVQVKVIQGYNNLKQNIELAFKRAKAEEYFAASPDYTVLIGGRPNVASMLIMNGAFWVDSAANIEFKLMQAADKKNSQFMYFAIDDKIIFNGMVTTASASQIKSIFLSAGIHTMNIVASDSLNNKVQIGIADSDGKVSPMPADWFDVSKNQNLAEYLKSKGKLEQTDSGFNLAMNDPVYYRKIKYSFEDFTGNQLAVSNIKASDWDGANVLPVTEDLNTGKKNRILEIASRDSVEVTYNDEKRVDDSKAVVTDKMTSSFCDARIDFLYEDVLMKPDGSSQSSYVKAKRAKKGDTMILSITDYDEDLTTGQDSVTADISTSSGEKLSITLPEDPKRPGVFSQTVKLGDVTEGNTIKVKVGDTITAWYYDKENNNPGVGVSRNTAVSIAADTAPQMYFLKTSLEKVEDKSPEAQQKIRLMKDRGDSRSDIKIYKDLIKSESVKVPENSEFELNSRNPFMFEIISPESAIHSQSTVDVLITADSAIQAASASGAVPNSLKIKAGIANAASLAGSKGYNVSLQGNRSRNQEELLELGVFAGIVRLQLGSQGDDINDQVANNDSLNLTSLSSGSNNSAFKVPTLIVAGSDKLHFEMKDAEGKTLAERVVVLRANGELELMDKDYLTPMDTIHIGQSFNVRVSDPDQDITNDRDEVPVEVVSGIGDKLVMKLTETATHSGVFTGSVKPELRKDPANAKTNSGIKDNNVLETKFGDTITFTYLDKKPLGSSGPLKVVKTGHIALGSDAKLASFSKIFKDPEMAVKTNFLMAESLFEMAKSHRAMGKDDLAKEEIARGKRVLEEALRDYPDTSLKAQGEFLLANLAQNLENYPEAVSRYSLVISRWPESEYAAKSQFQKAVCLERMDQGVQACEEYVKLTYVYPESPLVADAKVRLANFYYKNKNYKVASTIFRKFAENHPDHTLAPKSLFLSAQSALKYIQDATEKAAANKTSFNADYTDVIKVLQELVDKYQDDKDLRAEAMYWLADCYGKQGGKDGEVKAYQTFKKLTWDYPESKWAKIARGRLAESTVQE